MGLLYLIWACLVWVCSKYVGELGQGKLWHFKNVYSKMH